MPSQAPWRAPTKSSRASWVCRGLRWGEAVALRRRHVDLLRRRLRVQDSLAEVSGHFVFGGTKSHATRAVPLSPAMVTAIETHLEGVKHAPDALLFMGPRARGPLRYRYFYAKQWRPALERLGLPEVGVHVLRHSAAARIVAAGGSPKTLQSVLGHRSAGFSLTVYGHLFDADLDDLASRLDGAWSQPKTIGGQT
jgi:integrase